MRKKIFSGFMLAVATTAGIYAHLEYKQSHSLTALQLRNAEALTESEFDTGYVDPNDMYGYKEVDCKDSSGHVNGRKCEENHPGSICHLNSKWSSGCE